MRVTPSVSYAPTLSLLGLFLSSGERVNNTYRDTDENPSSTSFSTPRRRTTTTRDRVDASSSCCLRQEKLSALFPFDRLYPCIEEERMRLSCGIGCCCISSLVNGSPGVCARCQQLERLAESPGNYLCEESVRSQPSDPRHPKTPAVEHRDLENPDAAPAAADGSGVGEATPAPAPPSSPSATSNAPSPYPTFLSYVPSTSWLPTTTHRPTQTWYPSHTWRPSVTWYPSHSQRPSASPSSTNDSGEGGEDGNTNNPPSALVPSGPTDESPSANEPAPSPPSAGPESKESSGTSPSLPGQAAFGLIVVAAILIAVVYVVWSRSSSGNRRRIRHQELRNELELTETGRRNGDSDMAYDYHDRTGSYDPNELI